MKSLLFGFVITIAFLVIMEVLLAIKTRRKLYELEYKNEKILFTILTDINTNSMMSDEEKLKEINNVVILKQHVKTLLH